MENKASQLNKKTMESICPMQENIKPIAKESKCYRLYTEQEDSIIKDCIQQNPGCMSKGFYQATNLLGRTAKGIELRWYSVLKHQQPKESEAENNTIIINKPKISKPSFLKIMFG